MRMLSQVKRVHLGPWLIPGLYAFTAIAASVVLPRIEHYVFPHLKAEASIDTSIAIYSSIASGMMALTGIVFSLTFLMVQFSATAYSPRLVMWIARDPVLSHAVGVFSATFLYAIAALGWLDRNNSRQVPFISALVVIVLLLASVGMFVGLIHRIGRLQINRMLVFTGDQGRQVIEKLYGPLGSSSNKIPQDGFRALVPEQTLLHHGEPRSLESVNVNRLVKLAKQHDACIKVVTAVGDTVLEGTPLLHIFNVHHPFTEREFSKVLGTRRRAHV
jgi:uncharacterized membrane protein